MAETVTSVVERTICYVVCVWRGRELHTGFLWRSVKERDHVEGFGRI